MQVPTVAARVWREPPGGLDDHWDHCGTRAHKGILVLAILLFDPASASVMLERALTLAAQFLAPQDQRPVVLLGVAMAEEVANAGGGAAACVDEPLPAPWLAVIGEAALAS